jgi:GAG-pre-integrase domain
MKSSAYVAAQIRDVRSDASRSPQAHYLTANNPLGDTADVQTWNRRLGHTGADKVRDMILRGVLPSVSKVRLPCQDCMAGKQRRHPFPGAFSCDGTG